MHGADIVSQLCVRCNSPYDDTIRGNHSHLTVKQLRRQGTLAVSAL